MTVDIAALPDKKYVSPEWAKGLIENPGVMGPAIIELANTYLQLFDELEAAQARIADLDLENKDRKIAYSQLMTERDKVQARIAELEGGQEAVGEIKEDPDDIGYYADFERMPPLGTKLYTTPPKPVVKLPELEKWRSVDSYRAQMAYKSLVTEHLKANGITVEGE